jgi:hypothetical protein
VTSSGCTPEARRLSGTLANFGPSRSPAPVSTRIVWPGSLIKKALTDVSIGCLTHDLAISASASALLGSARTLRTKKPPVPSERAVTSILPIRIRAKPAWALSSFDAAVIGPSSGSAAVAGAAAVTAASMSGSAYFNPGDRKLRVMPITFSLLVFRTFRCCFAMLRPPQRQARKLGGHRLQSKQAYAAIYRPPFRTHRKSMSAIARLGERPALPPYPR